ncbi:hypothetical protein CPAV1605_1608 [seawater metagenome]|uniref:Uncharacterized protein n=1 Tax=seawater metagenome TaxID=1561972 RepID=A0A5E8CLH8_9ZZZZ
MSSLPIIFNKLPMELIDIIMNYYWSSCFQHVLNDINDISNKTKKLINSRNITNCSDLEHKYKSMCNLNVIINNLALNKGSKLIAKHIDNDLKFIFNSENNVYTDLNIGKIYNYLTVKSGYMRYYIYEDYSKLLVNK